MRRLTILLVLFLISLGLTGCGSSDGGFGGGAGANPAHDRELKALPVYPGSLLYRDPFTNGAGTFASFWAAASPTLVASFYQQELAGFGWRTVQAPRVVAEGGKRPQTLLTFVKGNLSLTVYLDENPSKGGQRGNLYVLLRMQDI